MKEIWNSWWSAIPFACPTFITTLSEDPICTIPAYDSFPPRATRFMQPLKVKFPPQLDEIQGFQCLGYSNWTISSLLSKCCVRIFHTFYFHTGGCLFLLPQPKRDYVRARLSPHKSDMRYSTGKRRKRKAGRTARAYCTHLAESHRATAAAAGGESRRRGAYWATRRRRSTGAPQHRRAAPTRRRRWRINS